MDDLFEKLKAEPPVLRGRCATIRSVTNASPRRESLPALHTPLPGKPANKCRSMSPTNVVKSCKVLLERKKMKTYTSQTSGKPTPKNSPSKRSPKKQTPTKAQQKLFEIALSEPSKSIVNLKQCKIRIKRENLEKLREEFAIEKLKDKENMSKEKKKSPATKIQKVDRKRKVDTVVEVSPPKKQRILKTPQKDSPAVESKKSRPSSGFFIKIDSSPPLNKKSPVTKRQTKPQSPVPTRDKSPRKINARSITSSPVWMTKATKFTRTQLIKDFGKRYFNSFVKIEQCKHPMMKVFDMNALARKEQAKNKSKNLSVSFREEVEVFGCSDTESNDSERLNNTPSIDINNQTSAIGTPTRLKKMENVKVIDGIEFDPKSFDKLPGNSNTPLYKKAEKKSYSPLKDDSTPSARSELLKLANEKLPPCGLLRLSADSDNDDEDDECEYIVPIELPAIRNSHTTTPLKNDKDLVDIKSSTTADIVINASNDDTTTDCIKESDDNINKDKEIAKALVSESLTKPEEEGTKSPLKQAQNLNEVEFINGNSLQDEQENCEKLEEHSNGDVSKASDKIDDVPITIVSGIDSCSITSNLSFTSDTQENIPDNLVKTAIEELSKDIEMSDMTTNESENTPAESTQAPIST